MLLGKDRVKHKVKNRCAMGVQDHNGANYAAAFDLLHFVQNGSSKNIRKTRVVYTENQKSEHATNALCIP
ncbi:MAG TPA: hypothetical protein QF753_22980, partial [Victivallales bacterium]|nr:hypothetical protein [Victivallales bacterium]